MNRDDMDRAISDTARLDWLELHGVDIGVSTHSHGSHLIRWHRGDAYGNTIREAIDNAMLQLKILNDPDDEPEAGNGNYMTRDDMMKLIADKAAMDRAIREALGIDHLDMRDTIFPDHRKTYLAGMRDAVAMMKADEDGNLDYALFRVAKAAEELEKA